MAHGCFTTYSLKMFTQHECDAVSNCASWLNKARAGMLDREGRGDSKKAAHRSLVATLGE